MNDLELPAQPMQPGYRVYSWVVPARAWTVGVNRVTLGVSQLLVPAEAGPSSDTRPLGAAVRMVRLELIGAE